MLLLGADPGLEGAIAAYDTQLGRLDVYDMPTTKKELSGRARLRSIIDEPELLCLMQMLRGNGASHLFVEEVGGRPGQSASAAFNFGRGYGALIMAARSCDLAIEPVLPQVWKREMRAPKDKKASIARASEVHPYGAEYWGASAKGSVDQKGGRAEAAMIVLYGERILRGQR